MYSNIQSNEWKNLHRIQQVGWWLFWWCELRLCPQSGGVAGVDWETGFPATEPSQSQRRHAHYAWWVWLWEVQLFTSGLRRFYFLLFEPFVHAKLALQNQNQQMIKLSLCRNLPFGWCSEKQQIQTHHSLKNIKNGFNDICILWFALTHVTLTFTHNVVI